jgi:hypothetical protein
VATFLPVPLLIRIPVIWFFGWLRRSQPLLF